MKKHGWQSEKNEKKHLFQYLLLIISISLTAACSSISSELVNEEEQAPSEDQLEERMERMVERGRYEEVEQFLVRNEEEIRTEEIGELFVAKIAESENEKLYPIMYSLFEGMKKEEEWEPFIRLLGKWTVQEHQSNLEEIQTSFRVYEDKSTNYESMDKDKNNIEASNKEIKENFPYEIVWTDSYLQEFAGYLKEEVGDQEYYIINPATEEEFLLTTFETEFKAGDYFTLYVLPGEEKEYKLKDGTSRTSTILYEIPQNELQNINGLMQNYAAMKRIEMEEEILDEESALLIADIENQLEYIFLSKDEAQYEENVTEVNEEAPEFLSVIEGSFKVQGVGLGDAREIVIEEWGTPLEEEIDFEFSGGLMMHYDFATVTLYDDQVDTIYIPMVAGVFNSEVMVFYNGDKYTDQLGNIYLHEPSSNQLAIWKEENNEPALRVMYSDGNFDASIRSGDVWRFD